MAEVIEVGSELGEPDCKLVNPMKMVRLGDDYTLEPWIDFSDQNEMMIHSDSILTMVDPTEDILTKYTELLK